MRGKNGGALPRLVWRFFFGNRLAPRFGRYQNFGAGGIEAVFEELGLTSRAGYFLEAGAYEGAGSSNTKYLELYCGWVGLLIEPEPVSANLATYHRTTRLLQAALVPTGFKASHVELEYSGLMTTADIGSNSHAALLQANEGKAFLRPFEERHRFTSKVVTLNDALALAGAPDRIDLISLDLEGIELEVLSGFDFNKYHVEYFLIEARSEDAAEAFFEQHGYKLRLRINPVGLLFSKQIQE